MSSTVTQALVGHREGILPLSTRVRCHGSNKRPLGMLRCDTLLTRSREPESRRLWYEGIQHAFLTNWHRCRPLC